MRFQLPSAVPLWARIVLYGVAALLVYFLVTNGLHGIKTAIFGDPRVAQEHGNTVVAQEQGQAAKETGIEATNTVVRTYEYHSEVDRTVKEGQRAIAQVDHGQQMDPDIDAATANALCRVHHDLCR